ncbi:MAG: SRPBCC family protein [Casimicrobiaceae bacterium]
MEMKGSRVVPADVEATWRALNDPDELRACIPGCESIERVSDTEYRVTMTARVGPVSAKFAGRLLIADLAPPRSYTLQFEGQGGAAGFANGTARVALAPADAAGTRIDYVVSAQVGGKLAQIGSRLVDGAAAKVADDFFARFVERVGGRTPEVQGVVAAPTERPVPLRAMRFRLVLAAMIIAAMAVYWWLQAR